MSRFVDDPRKPSLGHPFRDPETGKDFPDEIDQATFWAFYDAIQTWGIELVHAMAIACAELVKHELTEADKKRLHYMLTNIDGAGSFVGNKTEMVLGISYRAIRKGEITYEQAAHLASRILGTPIKADTWRRRVTRWADRQGLPKVERRQFHGRRASSVDDNTGQL